MYYVNEAMELLRLQGKQSEAVKLDQKATKVGVTNDVRQFLHRKRGEFNPTSHPSMLNSSSEELRAIIESIDNPVEKEEASDVMSIFEAVRAVYPSNRSITSSM